MTARQSQARPSPASPASPAPRPPVASCVPTSRHDTTPARLPALSDSTRDSITFNSNIQSVVSGEISRLSCLRGAHVQVPAKSLDHRYPFGISEKAMTRTLHDNQLVLGYVPIKIVGVRNGDGLVLLAMDRENLRIPAHTVRATWKHIREFA